MSAFSRLYRVLLVHTTNAEGPQNRHGPRLFPFFLLLLSSFKKNTAFISLVPRLLSRSESTPTSRNVSETYGEAQPEAL